jgi:probable HAF family extracellular repeat protein
MKSITLLLAGLVSLTTARAEFYLFSSVSSPSYPYIYASGINNNGDLVGTAYDTASRPVAYRYSGGSLHIYPSPGPSHSTWGNAINNNGTIVGLCDRTGHPSGNVEHAFYATTSGSSVDFDSDFSRNSEAKAIVDSGYVVGSLWTSGVPSPSTQSFLGHTGGWIMPLGPVLGASYKAVGLNDSLVVVGNGPWGGETYNAFSGTVTYMGYALSNNWTNKAAAINHSGVIAGQVGSQGYLYDAGAATLFGANVSQVTAMNNNSDVVGSLTSGHAFVYIHSNGHFLDLNTCVSSSVSAQWTLVSASGINDKGVICGHARRLATAAEQPIYGMYVYAPFKLSPLVLIPLPHVESVADMSVSP